MGYVVDDSGCFRPGAFDPRSVPGILLWLPFANFSDNGTTATWLDASGNGFHCSKAGAARPTAGAHAVSFSGAAGCFLQSSAFAIAADHAVSAFLLARDAGPLGSGQRNAFQTDGGWRWLHFGAAFFGTFEGQVGDPAPSALRTQYSAIWPGSGNMQMYKNSVFVNSGVAGATSIGTSYQVGADGTGANLWVGDVTEVLLYSQGVSAANQAKIEAYQQALP